MSLDLSKTAVQIDRMAQNLKARQNNQAQRLQNALAAMRSFTPQDFNRKWKEQRQRPSWSVARILDTPSAQYSPPQLPPDFCVIAADGSHIDTDRHLSARCFLINQGVSILTYGSSPDAQLYNQPKLYARDDELIIRDTSTYGEQSIEGAVLAAKRTVEEIRALVDAVGHLPADIPTLALLDGSLIMIGLVGHGYHDFVLRELIEEGFVEALNELKLMAKDKLLAIASYISLPNSTEVVNTLRLMVCSYEASNSEYRCGRPGQDRQPCHQCVGGVFDRELFAEMLAKGERSAMFATSTQIVERHYKGNDVHFFYVHTGEEIGRVDVPSWVSENDELLAFTHALVVDQCRRGRGYPVGLMEAHEQAVVNGADRRQFAQLVERALSDNGMPVYTSEKARSKRLRWL